jgi:hypothetical protein
VVATRHFTSDDTLDYHSMATSIKGEHAMSKNQDAKKNVKKAASKTPKEKKEAKRLKKAEKKH